MNDKLNKSDLDIFDLFSIILRYKLILFLPFIVTLVICLFIYFYQSSEYHYKIKLTPDKTFSYHSPQSLLIKSLDKRLINLKAIFKEIEEDKKVIFVSPAADTWVTTNKVVLEDVFSYNNFLNIYHQSVERYEHNKFINSDYYQKINQDTQKNNNLIDFFSNISQIKFDDNSRTLSYEFRYPTIINENSMFNSLHQYFYSVSIDELKLVFKYYIQSIEHEIDQIKHYASVLKTTFPNSVNYEKYQLLLFFLEKDVSLNNLEKFIINIGLFNKNKSFYTSNLHIQIKKEIFFTKEYLIFIPLFILLLSSFICVLKNQYDLKKKI